MTERPGWSTSRRITVGVLVDVPRVRVDDVAVLRRDAEAAQQRLRCATTGASDRLPAGHADHLVVEDEQRHVGVGATASSSGVTPECRKVLSPMTATTGRKPASEAPFAMPIDAPMQTHDSIGVERRQRAERVAADVGGHECRPGVARAPHSARGTMSPCGQPAHSCGGRAGSGQASHGLTPARTREAERRAHDVRRQLAVGRQVPGLAAEDLDAVDAAPRSSRSTYG